MKLKIIAYIFLFSALAIMLSSNTLESNEPTKFIIPCTTIDKISSTLPTDATILNQYCANSFAWEAFLALNWPAKQNPDSSYVDGVAADVGFDQVGLPGDLSPTVWETYADINGVFTNKKPPVWEDNQLVPLAEGEDCSEGKILRHLNKRTSSHSEDVNSLFQASGPEWLIAQNNGLVWYEVLVNETEFDFIYKNQLYDKDKLIAYGEEQENRIWLPTNSMELKASWLQFSDEAYENNEDNIQGRYKIVKACVPQDISFNAEKEISMSNYQPTYLGLVGLHIIAKTPSAPQLMWATFEHIDNVPTEHTSQMDSNYEFYNANCDNCEVNTPPKRVANSNLNTSIPNQTTRLQMNSIGKDAAKLNKVVKEKIIKENPESVWQNYQLVNVQWPNTAIKDAINNNPKVLEAGGTFPTVRVLGNPVAETYAQTISCMNCHQNARIKKPSSNRNLTDEYITTGYSFVFSKAVKQE